MGCARPYAPHGADNVTRARTRPTFPGHTGRKGAHAPSGPVPATAPCDAVSEPRAARRGEPSRAPGRAVPGRIVFHAGRAKPSRAALIRAVPCSKTSRAGSKSMPTARAELSFAPSWAELSSKPRSASKAPHQASLTSRPQQTTHGVRGGRGGPSREVRPGGESVRAGCLLPLCKRAPGRTLSGATGVN